MLVVCPCGKKLNIADTLVGKKVRCPVCKEAFLVQPDDSDKKGNVSIPKQQSKSRAEDSLPAKQQQKRRPVEEDADLLEEYDEEEQPRSSRKKRQDTPTKKSGTGLVRNIISSVVLVLLLIGAAVVFWYKFQAPGTVTFDIQAVNYLVFVDGKEIPLTNSHKMGLVSVTLSPGPHEVKITKDGCEPYLKKVTIKSGDDDRFEVHLFPTAPPRFAP